MIKKSKRYNERKTVAEVGKQYSVADAVQAIKKITQKKYDETISLSFQLGIRTDAGTENVRGTVSLPHGSGKSVKVICFCKGESVKDAEAAGADYVGAEELVAKVLGGWFDFDVVVAHPDMMREVSKLGRVLGPRGMMPTPKTGTVSANIGKTVQELKAGRIEFKSDKTGGVHAVCGKISFNEKDLVENVNSIIRAVRDAKPVTSKGDYLKSVTISPTQGPGFRLAVSSL